jgi:hypothetical protein
MFKIKHLIIVLCTLLSGFSIAQTTVSTNHSNNNGNGLITFHLQNTNSYPIIVTGLNCHLGTTTTNNLELLYRTTAIYDYAAPWGAGTIGAGQNGWLSAGTGIVNSSTANGVVTALSGLNLLIPAGATYDMAFSANTLQYMTLTDGGGANVNTFSAGGVNLITGDGIGWGGVIAPSTPANYPRGFIGGVTFIPAAGAALHFDGANDEVSMGNSMNSILDPLNKATVEAWVKPDNNTYLGVIAGNYNTPGNAQMQFLLRRDFDQFAFWVDDGTGFKVVNSGVATSTIGVWQHVAGVWDGSKLMIYINGVLKATTTGVTGSSFASTTNVVKLGTNSAGTPEIFTGAIDELRIWTIARSQCDINTYQNCEIATTATGLLANYHFNQGMPAASNATVTSLTDASGNAYNGTLSNFALTGTTSNWIYPGGVSSGSTTPASTPVIGVTVTNSVICNGENTTLTGTGALTYTWTGGVANGITFSPSSTQSYTVNGTAATGCTNTAVQGVTVNSLPAVTASASNSVICNGQSTTLNGSGAATYTWSGGITNSTPFSPTATQSYTVTGTSALGCTNTAVQGVTVNTLPSVTANVSSSVICEGFTTTFSGSGADTYTWTGSINDAVAFAPAASGSYTVTGTNTLTGCTNTAAAAVTVNTLPIVSSSITNSFICEGTSITVNGSGADTYTWSGGVTDNVAFTPMITSSYTVTGTNTLTGCTSTNVSVQSVTVNANPVLTAPSGVICNGGSFTITPSGAATYTISGGNNVVSPSSTANYTITGTSAEGCLGSAIEVTVSVQSQLTVSISGPSAICNGQAANLTANGASTYSWNTGATTNAIAPTPTTTTTYSVIGASGSCSDSTTVTINVNPNPTVSAVSNMSMICVGQSATLTASGASTYTWNTTATGASLVDSPTITVTYTVTGEDANGCTAMAIIQQSVSACTSVTSTPVGKETLMKVYPNPGSGFATMELYADSKVIVVNVLGAVISNETHTAGTHNLNISQCANGIYFVQVIHNGQSQIIKLIKE